MKVRIATRGSALALVQARWVGATLVAANPGLEIEEIQVSTVGDRVLDRPLAAIGGKGLFVSEVEALVARGEADIAVHSLKDVPGDVDLPEGLELMAFPMREDPRDVLLTRDGIGLDDLHAGAKVGTTSQRRVAQLSRLRPDLAYTSLRGNVGTRLGRLDAGELDAIVLAAAGLRRLGLLAERAHVILDPSHSIPAVGQGVLAIEARSDDARIRALIAPLDDAPTRVVVEAERALLRALLGSCRTPLAGHATIADGQLELVGFVGLPDGTDAIVVSRSCQLPATQSERVASAVALGLEVAAAMHDAGARAMMDSADVAVLDAEERGPAWKR